MSLGCDKKLAGGGEKDRRRNWFGVDASSDRNGVAAEVVQEIRGAVDGVNQPCVRGRALYLSAFFADDRIVGAQFAELFNDEMFARSVPLSHHVGCRRLGQHFAGTVSATREH